MMTLHTQLLSSTQLDRAAYILNEGGVVVLPTDTVYGVAVLARDTAAVERLYRAKKRSPHLPLPVMVSDFDQVAAIARILPGFWRLAETFWPGPLTLILPRRATLPAILTAGGDAVALRIPAHDLALQLLRLADGPLAMTSANLSGHAPALTAGAALAQLDGRVDVILDGGPAPGGQPSTIVDLTLDPPRILRCGPISEAQILEALARGARTAATPRQRAARDRSRRR